MTYVCRSWLTDHDAAALIQSHGEGSTVQTIYDYNNECNFASDALITTYDDGSQGDVDWVSDSPTCREHESEPAWHDSNSEMYAEILDQLLASEGVFACNTCAENDPSETPVFTDLDELNLHIGNNHGEDENEDADEPALDAIAPANIATTCRRPHPNLSEDDRHRLLQFIGQYPPDENQGYLFGRSPMTIGAGVTYNETQLDEHIARWRHDWPAYFYIASDDPHIYRAHGATTMHSAW